MLSEYLLLPIRLTVCWLAFGFLERKNVIALDEATKKIERDSQRVALMKATVMLLALCFAPYLGRAVFLGAILRFVEHCFRHPATFLVNPALSSKRLVMTKDAPFSFLHWNVALGSDFVNTLCFMPYSKSRINFIVEYIMTVKPDAFLLEEVWNEDVARILINKLKSNYKYIFCNVGFNTGNGLDWVGTMLTGMNSGLFFATNNEFEFRQFSRFNHMLTRDKPPARGALEVAIKLTDSEGAPH